MRRAEKWARARDLCGLMLEAQDVNVLAPGFIRNTASRWGGVDAMLYSGIRISAGERAVFWYYKF
jgi:hypothetical protein